MSNLCVKSRSSILDVTPPWYFQTYGCPKINENLILKADMQPSQLSTAQIVIPTFNRAQLLLKTLNSALNQTLPFDRITISDNSDSSERQHETRRVWQNTSPTIKIFWCYITTQTTLSTGPRQVHSRYVLGHSTTPCFCMMMTRLNRTFWPR